MSIDGLLSNFDRLMQTPEAVRRLRGFILDLAVRGKLVAQDPTDEPAAELVKRIAAEKVRLVKAGEIRKPKAIPALRKENLPFSLPSNWQWSQIAEIGLLSPRNEAADDIEASFVPMPMIAADYGVMCDHEVRQWREIKKGYTHFAEGDVGLAKITPCFQNGKSTVFRNLTGGLGSGTTELHIVRPLFVDPNFVVLFLKSPHFIETGIPKMTGTAGQKRVPTGYFAHSPFPLPPLDEQRRIVAKVDELMGLCDRLEAAQAERETTRTRLAAASLARLNAPDPDPATFREHVAFVLDNLAPLTTRPEQVKELRQTILNLAVRGKLVAQDPADEPATELVKRIAAEKKNYQANGFLKLSLPPVSEDEQPFPIPKSWEWTRLGNVSNSLLGKTLNKAKNRGTYKPYLRSVNVYWLKLKLSDIKEMKFEEQELEKYALSKGDVLVCEGGEAGRAAVWNGEMEGIYYQNALHRVRFFGKIDPNYFVFALCSDFNNGRLASYCTGITIKHLTSKRLAKYCFPLPPLAEQHRIVAKVDELMTVCDRLEGSLAADEATGGRLVEAVLHGALEPYGNHPQLAAD